jgi:hypothetical protein
MIRTKDASVPAPAEPAIGTDVVDGRHDRAA